MKRKPLFWVILLALLLCGALVCMAFVPTQEFDTPYDPVLAFSRGTIFPALDKPFLGEEAVPQ